MLWSVSVFSFLPPPKWQEGSDIDTDPLQNLGQGVPAGQGSPRTYRMLKFVEIILGWIPFFWEKTVFWTTVMTSGNTYANNYEEGGGSIFQVAVCPRLEFYATTGRYSERVTTAVAHFIYFSGLHNLTIVHGIRVQLIQFKKVIKWNSTKSLLTSKYFTAIRKLNVNIYLN
jgi:hypothetical protein